MKMTVKEVADLVGISVRTLHYYDKIGLLTPKHRTEVGYRLYRDEELDILQQILFLRALDFPLQKIKEIIKNPSFDRKEALKSHRKMLLHKRKQFDKMITTIDKTIEHLEGEIQMSNREKFAGFNLSDNRYEKEAREHWGDEAVNKANEALGNSPKAEEQMNEIYRKLAELKDESSTSNHVQTAIGEWYKFLNTYTGHHYSLEAFQMLGQMYVQDERFTKNIDQFGEGLAQFMCEAMTEFVNNRKSGNKLPFNYLFPLTNRYK